MCKHQSQVGKQCGMCLDLHCLPPDSSGTCGLVKFPGLSNFASGKIYDRLGCGMAVFSICVFVQTSAMFLFLQKCDLASGFGGYWF